MNLLILEIHGAPVGCFLQISTLAKFTTYCMYKIFNLRIHNSSDSSDYNHVINDSISRYPIKPHVPGPKLLILGRNSSHLLENPSIRYINPYGIGLMSLSPYTGNQWKFRPQHTWATFKTLMTFHWILIGVYIDVSNDPYFMAYEIITIYLDSFSSPISNLTNRLGPWTPAPGPCFLHQLSPLGFPNPPEPRVPQESHAATMIFSRPHSTLKAKHVLKWMDVWWFPTISYTPGKK